MKLPPFVHRWLPRFNLPLGLLIMFLQRTPVLREVVNAAEFVLASPFGNVLKSSLATAAVLGTVNTLAGATELSASTPSPAQLTVGVNTNIAFGVIGTLGDATSWSISGSLPPGLTFQGGRTTGTINVGVLSLSGMPTTAGNYSISMVAKYENIDSPIFSYSFQVTGAANIAPNITTQPQNQTVTAGANVTFTSGANGTPAPTFQWQKNGVDIGGATTTTLTLNNVQPGDAGNYAMVATNGAGTATSNVATLTVGAAPVAPFFTFQPASQAVTEGGMVTFTAGADGTPTPGYQWQFNGVNIDGATANFYSIFGATPGHAGNYTVVISNSAGMLVSNPATLTVNPATFAPAFTLQPATQSIAVGSPVTFTVAADGNPAPSFQWRKNGVNIGGATNTSYTIPFVTVDDAGSYTAVATNNLGVVASAAATLTVTSHVIGDFDGDGRSDIFWTNTATGERSMWFMNGTAVGGGTAMGAVPPVWRVSATTDFNGDGKADILLTNTATGDRAMWLMNGSNIAVNAFVSSVPVEWKVSGTADFNGDGKADIFWTNANTGDRAVWLMNGSSVALGSAYLTTLATQWVVSGTADFNGDGKADVLWTNTVTGERSMWFMNGGTIAGGMNLGTLPVEWTVSATADYNGDGKADILLTNTTTGDRVLWLMNASNITANLFVSSVPPEWKVSGSDDYNGDGRADIFWTNSLTGDRAIWLMNGNTVIGGAFLTTIPVEWKINREP